MGNAQLDLGRPRGENTEPALARGVDAGEPESRLPDPRLALEHQRGHTGADRSIEEGVKRADLVVPAQHSHGHTTLLRRHRDTTGRRSQPA
jgi:hypothetical protein